MIWACYWTRGNKSSKSDYENEREREKRKTKKEIFGYD